MKTLEQLISENNGKQVEVAGSTNARFQCIDLVNLYIRDVLGFPIVEWTNAQDFPKKCLPPKYEYILNGETNFPLKGDIVVWSSKDNVGHIAICIENGNIKNFKSFDQNWSKPLYCTLETHVYTGSNHKVIGWLRPKSIIQDMISDEQKRILDFLKGKTEGDVREAFGALADQPNKDAQIATLSQKVLELDNVTKKLQEQIDILTSEVKSNNEIIMDWQSKFQTANEQVSKATEQLNTITDDRNKYRRLYENLLSTTVDKYSAFELIKLGLKKLFIK